MNSSLDGLTVIDPSPARFSLWPLPELRDPDGSDGFLPVAQLDPDREERAYSRGLAEGQHREAEAAEARLIGTMALLTAATNALYASREGYRAAMEEAVSALALAVARQLIGREVAADPSVLKELVTRATAEVGATRDLTVRLHPEDLAALEGPHAPALPDLRLVPDESMSRGGCVVETPGRVVDARIETSLLELFRKLDGHA